MSVAKDGGPAATAPVSAPQVSEERPASLLSAVEDDIHVDGSKVVTTFIAETLLPTRHGAFRLRGYKHSLDGGATFTEPTAIISGSVEGCEDVAVRVHDACFTSEVLGSLKCDCSEQLSLALAMIKAQPPGMVIYLQQEGRGIGLANKIAAYALQERGLDTVDANRALGLPDDCREYTSVAHILADLGVRSVRLITNNPRKIEELRSLGINVTGRVPCVVAAGAYNAGYLDAKRTRMDHLLGASSTASSSNTGAIAANGNGNGSANNGADSSALNGDWCYWNHDGEPTRAAPAQTSRGGMGLPHRTPKGSHAAEHAPAGTDIH